MHSTVSDGKIHISCSDAASITLHTNSRRAERIQAEKGKSLTSAEFNVVLKDGYVRITVTDKEGKSAYTNAYFTDELF